MVKKFAFVFVMLLPQPLFSASTNSAFSLLSIPADNAEITQSKNTVEYISNGYSITDCKIIKSSGNEVADSMGCKTVSFRASKTPVAAETNVWIHKPVIGEYNPPTPTNLVQNWLKVEDYPSGSEQGTIVARVEVTNQGTVSKCVVASGSGFKYLDLVVERKFCKRIKVKPATLNGVPVASINFTVLRFYQGN
jgi:TonB family protein